MDIRYETPFGVFVWDKAKQIANLRKHKVDFIAAVEVFCDERAILRHDARHSEDEDRFTIVGLVRGTWILAVFFTDRDNVTRIVSARKATQREAQEYERQ